MKNPRKALKSSDQDGATAVEFAFIAPILLLFLFGIIAFSTLFATMHALQQLTSEAARASVAGIDDAERGRIVADFVASNATSYVFLDPEKLKISAAMVPGQGASYQVTLSYDNSASFIYMFKAFIPLPQSDLQRSAVIVRGGY